MPLLLIEFLYVLAMSKKTKWCLVVGLIGFLTFKILGHYLITDIELSGPLSILTDSIKEKLRWRYDRAAQSCLIGFSILAFKAYRKDKKRIL